MFVGKDLEMGKLVWIISGWAQNAIRSIIVRRKQRKIWHTEEENSAAAAAKLL